MNLLAPDASEVTLRNSQMYVNEKNVCPQNGP